jgi:hypothetical protein
MLAPLACVASLPRGDSAEQIIVRGLHADLMQAAARTGQTAASKEVRR